MRNSLAFLLPLIIITLFSISALEGLFAYFMFPATGVMLYYLASFKEQPQGNRILITGACLLVVFSIWQLIFQGEVELLRVIIYSIIILGAFEAWHFTSYTSANVWGLMNLVVFYIGLEYLMIEWLPYDIRHWLLGAPFVNEDSLSSWILYTGYQGITFWIWIGGLLLYKTFSKGFNVIPLILGVVIIIVPALISPGATDESSLYAQGEWIGRTAIWVSILILAYSFVKRKTK